MGCCVSREDGGGGAEPLACPYDAAGASSSARALNRGTASAAGPEPHSDAETATATTTGALTSSSSSRPPRRRGRQRIVTTTTTITHTTTTDVPSSTSATSAAAARVNAPLRRHVWTPRTTRSLPRLPGTDSHGHRNRVLPTRGALVRERADFFDTRVTGRSEIWSALQCVCELLRNDENNHHHDNEDGESGPRGRNHRDSSICTDDNDNDDDEEEGNLEIAQGILDAAGITVPTGDLGMGGAYDEAGGFYAVPGWVVAEPPESVVHEAERAEEEQRRRGVQRTRGGGGYDGVEDNYDDDRDVDDDGEEDKDSAGRKGKSVVNIQETTESTATLTAETLTARLSEDARDVSVRMSQTDTVRAVARRIAEKAGLPPTKRIRIAYLGQILVETETLEGQGWQPGHIVNALVFDTTTVPLRRH